MVAAACRKQMICQIGCNIWKGLVLPLAAREGRSPSSTFLCIRERDQAMVGICNIRHDLNQDYLLTIAGHIGYSIHPVERRKGYATDQLRLALLEAKKLGIECVLVTAADWNIGSQKTILANGGVLETATTIKWTMSACCATGLKMIRGWAKTSQ